MPITFLAGGGVASGNNASLTPTLPAHTTGDLLLCLASARGNGTLATSTGGWAELWQLAHSSSGINKIALFWKIATSAAETNPTITYTGGATGHTTIAATCGFRGVDQIDPFDIQGATSSNASQANIGPITGITTDTFGTTVIVCGHRADDWTSVATLTGDSLTWNEISEPDATAGNDAGLVWDYAIGATGVLTITDKTFTVTGGAAQTGMGVMQALNEAPVTDPPNSLALVGVGV